MKPEDEYPRYPKVIKMFRNRLLQFKSFLKEYKFGEIDPLQYEMTYINHIQEEEGWTNLKEVGNVFPDFCYRDNEKRFLPEPDRINWRTSFVLPNEAGRLHVTIRNRTLKTGKRMIFLDLTVRGIGNDKSEKGMESWFDLAREWIVRGFVDLTGKDVQEKVWRTEK